MIYITKRVYDAIKQAATNTTGMTCDRFESFVYQAESSDWTSATVQKKHIVLVRDANEEGGWKMEGELTIIPELLFDSIALQEAFINDEAARRFLESLEEPLPYRAVHELSRVEPTDIKTEYLFCPNKVIAFHTNWDTRNHLALALIIENVHGVESMWGYGNELNRYGFTVSTGSLFNTREVAETIMQKINDYFKPF